MTKQPLDKDTGMKTLAEMIGVTSDDLVDTFIRYHQRKEKQNSDPIDLICSTFNIDRKNKHAIFFLVVGLLAVEETAERGRKELEKEEKKKEKQ